MEENAKMQSLSNDLVRRLLNTRAELRNSYREGVVDGYGVKIFTSGYSLEQARRILLTGMKGYITKKRVRLSNGGRRIHRTSGESSHVRRKKKMLGKTSWYKGRGEKDKCGATKTATKGGSRTKKEGATRVKTRAVLFVDQSPQGELAKRLREQLSGLEPTLGYRVRVVERTGRSLQTIFSQTSIWEGLGCGREPCVTCNQ